MDNNNEISDLGKIIGKYTYTEFFAVREGIKPLMRTMISLYDYTKLKEVCKKSKLCIRHSKNILKFHSSSGGVVRWSWGNNRNKSAKIIVYISKDLGLIKKVAELENNIDLEKEYRLGIVFGYPLCCVESYRNTLSKTGKVSTPHDIYRNTRGRMSFLTNNIFLESAFKDRPRLVSYIPCSYNCHKSIMDARVLFRILREKHPILANEIKNLLTCPILYINLNNVFVFKGLMNKQKMISYQKILTYCKSPEFNQLYSNLKHGNKIRIDNRKLHIYLNDNSIIPIEKQKGQKFLGLKFY